MARVIPWRAVRRFCLDCQGESAPAVRACTDSHCALWEWRLPEGEPKEFGRLVLRAVRRHCLHCAGDRREVRACPAREACPLWSLRFGVRPETYKAVRQRFFAPKSLSLFG